MSGQFWTWSLAFYALDGVSPALIRLQDGRGLSVNALLYCLFLAKGSRELPLEGATRMALIERAFGDAVTRPVRGARRAFKSFDLGAPESRAALRQRLKDLELDLEAFHHSLLEAIDAEARPGETPESLASRNLRHYVAALFWPPAEVEALLGALDWSLLVARMAGDRT